MHHIWSLYFPVIAQKNLGCSLIESHTGITNADVYFDRWIWRHLHQFCICRIKYNSGIASRASHCKGSFWNQLRILKIWSRWSISDWKFCCWYRNELLDCIIVVSVELSEYFLIWLECIYNIIFNALPPWLSCTSHLLRNNKINVNLWNY
jgi:hypothetical protein